MKRVVVLLALAACAKPAAAPVDATVPAWTARTPASATSARLSCGADEATTKRTWSDVVLNGTSDETMAACARIVADTRCASGAPRVDRACAASPLPEAPRVTRGVVVLHVTQPPAIVAAFVDALESGAPIETSALGELRTYSFRPSRDECESMRRDLEEADRQDAAEAHEMFVRALRERGDGARPIPDAPPPQSAVTIACVVAGPRP